MDERSYVRVGAGALIVGGVIAAAGNLLHPRYPDTVDVEVYRKLAHSGVWRVADGLILVAIVLVIAGASAVAASIEASRWGVLARFGRTAVLVGGSIALAQTSLDMFAFKEEAQSFVGAAGPDRNPAFWATNAIDKVGLGLFNLWTIVFLGVAPLLIGLAMLRSDRFPSWVGALAVFGGAACTVVGAIGLFVSDQSTLTIPFLLGSLLVTAWYLAAGAVAWRSTAAT